MTVQRTRTVQNLDQWDHTAEARTADDRAKHGQDEDPAYPAVFGVLGKGHREPDVPPGVRAAKND